jgi:uncharacterized RDD family membrane protein YckC
VVYAGWKARLFAKFIDLLVVMTLGITLGVFLGSILGFVYSLVGDGLPIERWRGQSLGKVLAGIRVVDQEGRPASLRMSVIRNIPVGLVTFLMVIPFWGWILSALVGIPLGLIELSLIARAERHQRLGDVMADSVVERVGQR